MVLCLSKKHSVGQETLPIIPYDLVNPCRPLLSGPGTGPSSHARFLLVLWSAVSAASAVSTVCNVNSRIRGCCHEPVHGGREAKLMTNVYLQPTNHQKLY